ncbi:MAG: hypothetical protein HYZ53_22575 [Planctomycetes bacterium]|nr:hypothetical protein [Planctomycetota bacterium]
MPLRVLYLAADPSTGTAAAAFLASRVAGAVVVAARPADPPPAGDFDVVIGARFAAETLDRYPSLRFVLVPFAGVPLVDRETVFARPRLTLLNSHWNAPFVAEHAWALFLALVKHLVPCDRAFRLGDWSPRHGGAESGVLRGRTCGIVGLGAVGRHLARFAEAFGMPVLATRRADGGTGGGLSTLHRLLAEADVVFVCVPLTTETRGLLGARELALMKPGAALVNVARGEVVDEDALYHALSAQRIVAALDTWYSYPPTEEARARHFPSRLPFHELDTALLSPHRAAHVAGGEEARLEDVARILAELAAGRTPQNVVDRALGY